MDQTTSTTEPISPSSLSTRLMNVFTAPTELYTEVAKTPIQRSSWVVPYVISILLAFLFIIALYANESLRQQAYDVQIQTMQKALEQGQMTQAQFDQARDRIEGSGPVLFVVFGGIPAAVVLSILFFGAALALWLAAKFGLKATAGYQKLLEVYGLASFIGILGVIATLLTMYAFDSLHATPSAALAVLNSFDHTNKLHIFLSHLDVFTLWQTALVGVGISKISGKSLGAGMSVTYGLWLIWAVIATLLGIGIR
jgi:hypothetical protein